MRFPASSGSLDGIINYVTTQYKSSLDKFIRTSSSSYNADNWGDSNALLDLSSTTERSSCFCSINEPFSNVSIYFLKHKVYLKSYTITSRPMESLDMLKSWNIYGSNDIFEWVYIDSKGPTNDLIVSQTKKTYSVNKPGKFRYFRITQTGPNSSGRDAFLLGKIEFFGELLKINNDKCTSKSNGSFRLSLCIYHIILVS